MKPPCRQLAVATLVLACALTAAAEDGAIVTTRLTERLYLLSTDQGQYTTNSLVSVGADGVLIVDTQSSEYADELRRVVDRFGKGAPRLIVNTHRHVEHVGGNAAFGPEPLIIAHDLVRSKLRRGAYLFEEFPDDALPDLTFADRLTLYFNGERIVLTAMPGSHDDNEIIVHFTESKVVHLSSLANGFNFPSVDRDGSVLAFPELVGRALDLLPEDVVIVSGHNRTGTMDDLRAYHRMLVQTIETVRQGLGEGKDEATLQRDRILEPWSAYAGSYVSPEEWISSIVSALQSDGAARKADVFEPLYRAYATDGAIAAVALYRDLVGASPDRYELRDVDLLVVGLKLLKKADDEGAAAFLEASLELYPENGYAAFSHARLATVRERLGDRVGAIEHARRSVAIEPENPEAAALLARLGSPTTPRTDAR